MNFREMRARLISTYGNFVIFPDDPEASKVVSTRAFSHLVIDEEITLYAHRAMEEQVEEELEENYNVIYGEPKLSGIYNVSPSARAWHLNFRYRNGENILKKALKKPFDEELEIIIEFSRALEEDFNRAVEEIKMGMTTGELKRVLECNLLRHSDGFMYETIVVAGARARLPVPKTSDERVEKEKIIYIDVAPVRSGYPLPFSRVLFTEQRKEWLEKLQRINDMYSSLAHILKPGLSCIEVDSHIRKIGDFPHYSAVPSGGFYQPYAPGECIIEENMLLTVVPSIYLKDGLIRVKRNVAIRKRGPEFLI